MAQRPSKSANIRRQTAQSVAEPQKKCGLKAMIKVCKSDAMADRVDSLRMKQRSKESDQQSNLLKHTTEEHHRNVVSILRLQSSIIKKVKLSSTEFIQISNQTNSVTERF
jgi:hypothetical protein